MRDHTVVVGFGTKGRSAIQTVCATGLKKEQVVVVDPSSKVVDAATAEGYAGVVGDATRSDVLKRAEVHRARQIIITSASASAAGRLLGLSVLSPAAGMVMEDLIQQGSGLDMIERTVLKAEVGRAPRETEDVVVSVVRGHRVLGYDDPAGRDTAVDGPADHHRAGVAGRTGRTPRPAPAPGVIT